MESQRVIDNKTGKVLEDVTVIELGQVSQSQKDELSRLLFRAEKASDECNEYLHKTNDWIGYEKLKEVSNKMWNEASDFEDGIMMNMWDRCLRIIDSPTHQIAAKRYMEARIKQAHNQL